MRNGMTFPNTLTFGRGLKICIAISLCCYIALLGVIALTHNHTEHLHFENTCTACFYNSQHVGVEVEASALASPFLFSTTLPFYEAVFLPLRLTANAQSRAPPVFSSDRPALKGEASAKVMRKHLWNSESDGLIQRSSLLFCQARQ